MGEKVFEVISEKTLPPPYQQFEAPEDKSVEADEKKPSFLRVIKTPTFWIGLVEILFSFFLVTVVMYSFKNLLAKNDPYRWITGMGILIPINHAIFSTNPAIMGTLLMVNSWYDRKCLYAVYLIYGFIEMAYCFIGIGTSFIMEEEKVYASIVQGKTVDLSPQIITHWHETAIQRYFILAMMLFVFAFGQLLTCGSTFIGMCEIFTCGAIFWAFAIGLRNDTFFGLHLGNAVLAAAPVWIVMLFIGTTMCFIKENWVYKSYLALSTVRFYFGIVVLVLAIVIGIYIKEDDPFISLPYTTNSPVDYSNQLHKTEYIMIWIFGILFVGIDAVLGVIVYKEYKRKNRCENITMNCLGKNFPIEALW